MEDTEPKPTILIVEPHEGQRLALRFLLNDDYSIVFATNGQEALAEVKARRPQLIVMDVFLPMLNGWEAAGAIRRLGYAGAIIITTAFPHAEDSGRVREFGVTDYVVKPFDVADFRGLLKQRTDGPSNGRS
jgi:CheY-like chemotaxis protein